MIRAVVFDLDDTLYEAVSAYQKGLDSAAEIACGEFGLTGDEFLRDFETAKKDVKSRMGDVAASHNRMLYFQRFLENIGEKPSVHALRLYEAYWDTALSCMQTFPYVMPLLNELRDKGIRTAILTDLTAHIQHRKIARLGIGEYIDVLVTSEEAGYEKPDSRAFGAVIKKLEGYGIKAEEMLMIGDSMKKDIEGALGMGMHGLLFELKDKDVMDRLCMEYIKGQEQTA